MDAFSRHPRFFTPEVHEVSHKVKKRRLLSAYLWQRFTTKDNSAAIASCTSVKNLMCLHGKVDGYGVLTNNIPTSLLVFSPATWN